MKVSIVVLAAGASPRMEGLHKPLLDIGGEPLVRRTTRTALALEAEEIVVVTGFNREAVRDAVKDLPVKMVHNPRFDAGQPVSVAAGVAALEKWCDAIMVLPCDLALVTTADLRFLCDSYESMQKGSILLPTHQGARGNPVLFAASHAPEVTSGHLNVSCRRVIEDNPDWVTTVEADSDCFTFSLDTSADYERLLARLKTPAVHRAA